MGMDPASLALMIGMIGSSAVGGITAPQGQKLQSFGGKAGIDPSQLLSEGKNSLTDYLSALVDNADQPVKIATTVNPLPNFRGGALPMAIAAPGMDPNRINPALRETPGFGMSKRTLGPTGGGDHPPLAPANPVGPPPRTAFDPRTRSTGQDGGDDQAYAAAELLSSLGEGTADGVSGVPNVGANPGLPRRRLQAAA